MKVIYSKLLPPPGFYAITILNCIFVREKYKNLDETYMFKKMINHESIHFEQEKELGFILFYVVYFIEWLIKLIFFGKESYNHISFEQEAYNNERDFEYLKNRKRYSWIKYIFK